MSWWKDLDNDSEERHYSIHTEEYKNHMIYHIMKKTWYRFDILHNLTSCIPFIYLIDFWYIFSFRSGMYWEKPKWNNCFDWKEKELKNISTLIKDIRIYFKNMYYSNTSESLQFKS